MKCGAGSGRGGRRIPSCDRAEMARKARIQGNLANNCGGSVAAEVEAEVEAEVTAQVEAEVAAEAAGRPRPEATMS